MNNVYDDKKLQKAFEDGYATGREEGRNITACIEAELSQKCEMLKAENAKLELENGDLREQFESMETEFFRMRAQLDIVHLIFGGK